MIGGFSLREGSEYKKRGEVAFFLLQFVLHPAHGHDIVLPVFLSDDDDGMSCPFLPSTVGVDGADLGDLLLEGIAVFGFVLECRPVVVDGARCVVKEGGNLRTFFYT